jgi:hypothetical protein
MTSPEVAKRIEQKIPHQTVAQMVQYRPDMLEDLPQDFPARDYAKRLLANGKFLELIPRTFMVQVVESPTFRPILDDKIVAKILWTRPDLPPYLGEQGLRFGSLFLTNKNFLNGLPCAVFMNSVMNSTFVDRLSPQVLKAFSRNSHFWSCLPVEMVRHMMRTTTLGTKLNLDDIIFAAKTMSKSKKMDYQVVTSIFQIQFPQLINTAESNYYDWFNSRFTNSYWKFL